MRVSTHLSSVAPTFPQERDGHHPIVCSLLHTSSDSPDALYTQFRPLKPSTMAAVTTSQTLARDHSGHAHRHHDNSFLVSKDRNDAAVRITRIGLFVNIGMALTKGVGGVVFHSQGVIWTYYIPFWRSARAIRQRKTDTCARQH